MEEWLAPEKERTLEKVAADGGDKSVRAPLSDDSLKSNTKLVEDDGCCSKSQKPKISKGKRKLDDRDSKGVTKKQKVLVDRTGPKFKRPLDFRLFKTAADLEILGMRRLRAELEHRQMKCKGTLQERAKSLFEDRLHFPHDDDVWRWSLGLQPNLFPIEDDI